MKSSKFCLILILLLFGLSVVNAQDSTKSVNDRNGKQHGIHFIDEDGDGYNDNAPDHDGDGIPNGLDPDWQKEKGKKGKRNRWRFVDLDGDGINDNLQGKEDEKTMKEQIQLEQQTSSSMEAQEKKGGNQQNRKRSGRN